MSDSVRPLSVLEVRPAALGPPEFPSYVTYLVDGRDLLDDLDADWFGSMAYEWTSPLTPIPLAAVEEPRPIALGGSQCDIYCCGAIWTTVRRQGDEVVWSDWANTQDDPGPAPMPDELRFDARQYDAALARMAADHSWERPVDTVARLLEETFCDDGHFPRHDATLVGVWTRRDVPERVELMYRTAAEHMGSCSGALDLSLDPSAPPEDEARRLTAYVRSADPRKLLRDR